MDPENSAIAAKGIVRLHLKEYGLVKEDDHTMLFFPFESSQWQHMDLHSKLAHLESVSIVKLNTGAGSDFTGNIVFFNGDLNIYARRRGEEDTDFVMAAFGKKAITESQELHITPDPGGNQRDIARQDQPDSYLLSPVEYDLQYIPSGLLEHDESSNWVLAPNLKATGDRLQDSAFPHCFSVAKIKTCQDAAVLAYLLQLCHRVTDVAYKTHSSVLGTVELVMRKQGDVSEIGPYEGRYMHNYTDEALHKEGGCSVVVRRNGVTAIKMRDSAYRSLITYLKGIKNAIGGARASSSEVEFEGPLQDGIKEMGVKYHGPVSLPDAAGEEPGAGGPEEEIAGKAYLMPPTGVVIQLPDGMEQCQVSLLKVPTHVSIRSTNGALAGHAHQTPYCCDKGYIGIDITGKNVNIKDDGKQAEIVATFVSHAK